MDPGTGALHLVRHGPPAIDPDVPSPRWTLAPGAADAVAALAASGVLPGDARWFSSPEPKALATARLLTDASVTVYDALAEVDRPGWFDDFDDRALAAFAAPDRPGADGWETYADAAARIARGARKVTEGLAGAPIVLVGHGTAFTLLVAELTGTPADTAGWRDLVLPDHCALAGGPEGPDGPPRLVSRWGDWRRPSPR